MFLDFSRHVFIIVGRQFETRGELGMAVGKHMASDWDGMQTLSRDVLFALEEYGLFCGFGREFFEPKS